FYGDQSVIVVTRDDDVEFPTRRAHKDRVAGVRATDIYAILFAARLDGRNHFRSLFKSEQSPFSAVRVQRGHRDARMLDPVDYQFAVNQTNQILKPGLFDIARDMGERHMRGEQRNAQQRRDECHCEFIRLCQMRQKFRVPREMIAGQVERYFVDRRGGQRVQLMRKVVPGLGCNELGGRVATVSLFPVHLERAGNVIQVVDDWRICVEGDGGSGVYAIESPAQTEDPRPMVQVLSVANYYRRTGGKDFFFTYSLQRNFRTDTGRITNCEADARPCPSRGGACACGCRHSSQVCGPRKSAIISVALILVHILDIMLEDEEVRAFITV